MKKVTLFRQISYVSPEGMKCEYSLEVRSNGVLIWDKDGEPLTTMRSMKPTIVWEWQNSRNTCGCTEVVTSDPFDVIFDGYAYHEIENGEIV